MNYKEELLKIHKQYCPEQHIDSGSPVIIQITGKGYTDFIGRFQKPFDEIFLSSMKNTLKYLCSKIPECVYGYSENFDFTLVLNPSKSGEGLLCSGYDIHEISSMASSMATLRFNRVFEKAAKSYVMAGNNFDETNKLSAMQGYVASIDKGALFTAKVFNLPSEQVFGYIHLQQKHRISSGIFEMGLAYFNESEISGRSSSEIQFMVFDKAGVNFDNYPNEFKRGLSCVKNNMYMDELIDAAYEEDAWVIDKNIPILKDENRDYIDDLLQ